MHILKNDKLIFVIFLFCCSLTYWVYSHGFTGAFYFDDFRPLEALENIHDNSSALQYVINETSGPLGRPIAMFSFLLNIGDWPNHPDSFFRINTIIHILNGVFVYFISFKLFKILKPKSFYHSFLALLVSTFWLLLPLNVSTSLIAIQRMASLSGSFVFLGVLAYLYALDYQQKEYKKGSFTLYGSIAIFTICAMFTKENGILLPLLLFVIEITLLTGNESYKLGRRLRLITLGGCYLLVLLYLGSLLPNIESRYIARPYTFIERISTEPQILLDYVKLIFVPDIFLFSPFHDNYPVNQNVFSSFYSAFSAFFWIILIIISIIYRNKFLVFSFMILWFLTAHILESTIIQLELYYEHRNYVATFAVCFAVVYAISTIHGKKSQIFMSALLSIYIIGLAYSTYLVCKTWGDQYYAAYAWQYNQKGSMRASEHLALKLLSDGNKPDALMFVRENAKICDDCLNSYIQQMLIACNMNLKNDVKDAEQYLLNYSKPLRSIAGLPSTLATMFEMVQEKQCTQVSLDTLKKLNIKFLQSPSTDINVGNHIGIYSNLYRIALVEHDVKAQGIYIDHMWALSHLPWIADLKLSYLLKNNQIEKAIYFANTELCKDNSSNTLQQSCIAATSKIKQIIYK